MTGVLLSGAAAPSSRAAERQPFEQYIRRFERSLRHRLRKLKAESPWLGDLLYTFPGAAVCIAAGRQPASRRQEAKRLVVEGRSLSQAAAALGLPLWTRSLPPEAFTGPLGDLPGGHDFARRIANCLPRRPEESAMWLRWVSYGSTVAGPEFALWLAREDFYHADPSGGTPILPLAAYAWFSSQPGTVGRNLMRRRWSPGMQFVIAVGEAAAWLDRVLLDYCLGWFDANGWYRDSAVGVYRFIPLLSRRSLEEEGSRMNNCVATYATKVSSGRCLIYSVRRGARRVATLEIVTGRGGAPAINQLYGPHNTQPPCDVKWAVESWLAQRTKCPLGSPTDTPLRDASPAAAQRWREVWKPFRESRPELAAVLHSPAAGSAKLRKDLVELGAL